MSTLPKACPCPRVCLHCQFCWAAGRVHNEFRSSGGLGSHVASHAGAVPVYVDRGPHRDLDKGERDYVRRRLEYVVAQLAREMRCSQAAIVAALPKVLKEPRRVVPPVDPEECMPSGPGILVGMQLPRH